MFQINYYRGKISYFVEIDQCDDFFANWCKFFSYWDWLALMANQHHQHLLRIGGLFCDWVLKSTFPTVALGTVEKVLFNTEHAVISRNIWGHSSGDDCPQCCCKGGQGHPWWHQREHRCHRRNWGKTISKFNPKIRARKSLLFWSKWGWDVKQSFIRYM